MCWSPEVQALWAAIYVHTWSRRVTTWVPAPTSSQAGPISTTRPSARALQVICVDNFFTGSKENIKHLLGKPNFEILRHDVVEKLLLEVDQIYHLACPASPVHYK